MQSHKQFVIYKCKLCNFAAFIFEKMVVLHDAYTGTVLITLTVSVAYRVKASTAIADSNCW